MKVKLASTAGFCMGVRRAMEMVLEEANRSEGPLYTFGPLIHNRQVMDLLEKKGIHSVHDLEQLEEGDIVIRAHGIPPHQRRLLKKSGLGIIDGTCPKVVRVQSIIRYHTRKGLAAVIVGDKEHAEVIGLMGYAEGPVFVLNSVEEVADLPQGLSFIVVAQTTQDERIYEDISREMLTRFPGTQVFHTICDATHQRQDEVRGLTHVVDAMVVVGGYHSGNTRRLVQISKSAGVPTFHVETEHDLDLQTLSRVEIVGVTAGASTPNWMIKNIVRKIETIQDPGRNVLSAWIKKIFKFLLLSNIVIAAGAASLTYATIILSGRTSRISYSALAFLYIYAMHVLNRLLDKGASAYNDPEMAAFYKRHLFLLCLTGLVAISSALFLAYRMGKTPFFALAGFSFLGMLYSVPLMPAGAQKKYPYAKIKDIPGSKTLSESLAWVAVISILPRLNNQPWHWPVLLSTSLVIFLLSYARSALLDVFQLQGDLIVGKETLPVTLGLKMTSLIIKWALLISGILLAAGPLVHWMQTLAYPLLLCVLGVYLCLLAYERQWIYPGFKLEALVECNFLLAGLLALLWRFL